MKNQVSNVNVGIKGPFDGMEVRLHDSAAINNLFSIKILLIFSAFSPVCSILLVHLQMAKSRCPHWRASLQKRYHLPSKQNGQRQWMKRLISAPKKQPSSLITLQRVWRDRMLIIKMFVHQSLNLWARAFTLDRLQNAPSVLNSRSNAMS